MLKNFQNYLLTETKCNNNGSIKLLQMLKKIIMECYRSGIIKKNPFVNLILKKSPFERGFLSIDELNRIRSINLNQSLSKIRDIFIFCCYTGLSFSDVQSLKKNNIKIENDGFKWINIKRKKTNNICMIPLLDYAEQILNKYDRNNNQFIFHKISNQKVNLYLKKIVKLADIEKNITFHMARHTFATTITLNNNVSIETVSKMLGHSNIKTTQIYAKVLKSKISYEMNQLRNIL